VRLGRGEGRRARGDWRGRVDHAVVRARWHALAVVVLALFSTPLAGQVPRGTVVTDTLWSQALGTWKHVVVWLPPSYVSGGARRYPVAYYLHGAYGDETNWTALGRLGTTLDSLVAAGTPEMIVVMPDGDDGFYSTWNFLGDYAGCRRDRPANAEPASSYCVPWPHYDDYITYDVVRWVDRTFRTLADRRHRGIAGLSMGGYGAISLALAYPQLFSAAASHSGVIAPPVGMLPRPAPADRIDIEALRASYGENRWKIWQPVFGKDSASWTARDPRHLAARLAARHPDLMPALMVYCGTEDPYLVESRAFREALQRLGIPLDYAEYTGSHSWDYWRRHSPSSAAWLATRLSVP